MVRVGHGVPDRQNIFALYNDNGESAFFWVKRFSWHRIIAYVIDIGGIESGELDQFGEPPYYGNPKVTMAYFSTDGVFQNINIQTACGAYSWAPLDTPEWWDEEMANELEIPFWEWDQLSDSDENDDVLCHCVEPMETDHFCECECVCKCMDKRGLPLD